MTQKTIIPIGPYHPALEEPTKIELSCEGEVVKDATLHVGFAFRGVEILAEKRNFIQDIAFGEFTFTNEFLPIPFKNMQ